MTRIALTWDRTGEAAESGTVTFAPTRRWWRDDSRTTTEPVTVEVPAGGAVLDVDPTGETWAYRVTWAPDGPLALEWTEYVTVPPPPAEGVHTPVPYRELQHLTRDAVELLTGERALTAAAALTRITETAGDVDAAVGEARAASAAAAEAGERVEAATTATAAAAQAAQTAAEDAADTATALRADADALEARILAQATPDLSGYATTEQLAAATSAPRVVPLVTDGSYLGAAGGEDVPLGTLGQVTNTSFVTSEALLIRSSLSRWSSWSILRGSVSMGKTWLNGNPYPEVGIISIGVSQTEARVVNFSCTLMGYNANFGNWNWSVFAPDDMFFFYNGAFFYRWSRALGITPTDDYVHPETGEVGKLYPLKAMKVDVPDYGGTYDDDALLAEALTFDASRIRLVRTAK